MLTIPTTITPDLSRRAGRMLAAGRLNATVTSKATGKHVSVQIKCCINQPDAPYGQKWPSRPVLECTHVYISAGRNDKVGTLYLKGGTNGRFYKDQNADAAREYAAAMVLRYACGEDFESEIVEADQCGRCGHKLEDPQSIERGIGPECFGKETVATHQTKRASQTQMSMPEDENPGEDPGNRAERELVEQEQHDYEQARLAEKTAIQGHERVEAVEVAIYKCYRDILHGIEPAANARLLAELEDHLAEVKEGVEA